MLTQVTCLQILELIVSPVLSAFATAKEMQQSQMLNVLRPAEVDAACQQQLGMPVSAAIRGLQLLPDLQDWALFGMLICPGNVLSFVSCVLQALVVLSYE